MVDIAQLVRQAEALSRPENRNRAPTEGIGDILEGGSVVGTSRARVVSLRRHREDDATLARLEHARRCARNLRLTPYTLYLYL